MVGEGGGGGAHIKHATKWDILIRLFHSPQLLFVFFLVVIIFIVIVVVDMRQLTNEKS